jgi:succinate dehydrogenase hydrophobic anchor subunit
MRDQALWTWHLGAAVVICILLGLHMTIMHLDEVWRIFSPAPGEEIDWANVVARAKSAAFMINYILLLGAALFHGLYGLRNILFELNPGSSLKRGITAIFVAGGLGLFVLGTWAAIVTYQHTQIL